MLLLLLAACGNDISVTKQRIDSDGDGYATEVDCDDAHQTVNPDAAEVCDGLDNDCDGVVDDEVADAPTWYMDADGDGFGDEPVVACEAPEGAVEQDGDCDDDAAGVFPGAEEVCDGVDQDCDGEADEDAVDAAAWYTDSDGDGHGDGAVVYACEAGDDLVGVDGDCNDADPAIHPGAAEDCAVALDANCDGSYDYADVDGDGVPACEDCDDANSGAYPGAAEVCDGVDQDCDGIVDEDVTETFYGDGDGDGFGDAGVIVVGCAAPVGFVADATDCDDGDGSTYPTAPEVCDGVDHDCDGAVDESSAVDAVAWYADGDGDGHGDAATALTACDAPGGYVASSDDCDETNPGVHPGAIETCDGVDQDCDGTVDDGAADATTWYADTDGDSHGDATSAVTACEAPAGHVVTANDCDDGEAGVYPGAVEVCDKIDQDCDGNIDEDAADALTWYVDDDGDAYGAYTTIIASCDAPTGFVATAGDCDDAALDVYPGAPERCDGVDHDCNGAVDEATAVDVRTWYADTDGDTYGNASVYTTACDAPAGYVANAADCDDSASGTYPGATEVCDAANTDEDCDGLADDADPSLSGRTTWYRDADGDTYGLSTSTLARCDQPVGYVANATDCNDSSAGVNPAATEICDTANTDEDCNGLADDADSSPSGRTTWYRDADGDTYGLSTSTLARCDQPVGYVTDATDCNDAAASANPGATEVCDTANTDEDCDGFADDLDASVIGQSNWYADNDNDGYGGPNITTACDAPSAHLATSTDCDDAEANAHPGGVEVCGDGIDQDCSGSDASCPLVGDYSADDSYDVKIYGDGSGDGFSHSIATGDFNGDGESDLLVGASQEFYSSSASHGGVVYGYYGPFTSGVSSAYDTNDFLKWSAQIGVGDYGERIYNLGDLTDDGKDDLAIGYGSVVSLFYGGDTGSANNTTYDGYFPCAAADGAGDFENVAGSVNWVCGYPTNTSSRGLAYVYRDNSSTVRVTLNGEYTGDAAGSAVAGGGDVDGDGIDDLWVGAHLNDAAGTYAGALYLLYGPVSGTLSLSSADVKVTGNSSSDYLGNRALMPGDVDGDGKDDVMVTAQRADFGTRNQAGELYVITTPVSGTADATAYATVGGETAYDYLGYTADPAVGDINGDGDLDLLAGSTNHGGNNEGVAWLVYGPLVGSIDLSTDADASWYGVRQSDRLGDVAVLPDSDGDGRDEIVLGAEAGDHNTYTDRGAVWIWYGS